VRRDGALAAAQRLISADHRTILNPVLGIDTIDPASYTVVNGDGPTTPARDAGVDVDVDAGPAGKCGASVPI
jgi:hypothetical protein